MEIKKLGRLVFSMLGRDSGRESSKICFRVSPYIRTMQTALALIETLIYQAKLEPRIISRIDLALDVRLRELLPN